MLCRSSFYKNGLLSKFVAKPFCHLRNNFLILPVVLWNVQLKFKDDNTMINQ